ncbi:MAG: mechanosensitive ion channel [Bdellovibrionales bacterium]|nr:mechanosensitive ion channel [Bdellovibrionales bacterium]
MNDQDIGNISSFVEVLSFTKITLLLIGVIVLGIAVKFVAGIGATLHAKMPSRRLLIAQIVTVTSFAVYILGGTYLFYGIIQPPKALLLAVSGTLAVALGLSLKDLIASVVAGVILLFDRPFQVGDRVTFDGTYGEITSIGLRAVRLVTLDDSVVTIPNSKFITDLVSSGNFGALDMMIEINFHVDLASDISLARKLLHEAAITSRFVFLKKPVSIVLTEVNFSERPAMQIRVKCYVIDVRFEKALQSDILLRGNEALKAAGISRPKSIFQENTFLKELVK